jgi:hypothetical protein
LVESNNLVVSLDELERAVHVVVQHLKQQAVQPELSDDYYWEISEEERYDPTKSPTDLSLGQLSEDWDRIQQILRGEAPPIGYALVWVASLLRRIGSTNVA